MGKSAVTSVNINQRIVALKLRAAQRYNICPEKCHLGHVVLQAMLDMPDFVNQVDGVTGQCETNGSVANRACRLASAMKNFGLTPGDRVIIIGPNHLDLCIPYFACHFNGYTMCAMDPSVTPSDLMVILSNISPKIVFCPKEHVQHVEKALLGNRLEGEIITFDGETNLMDSFIKSHDGTEINFRPEEFDKEKIIQWLMMTSGTTGLPKCAMIPASTLINSIHSWWSRFPKRLYTVMAMGTIQWMSSLLFYISGPVMKYTRLQTAVPLTPQILVMLINKYRPNATAWTAHMLGKFLAAAGDACDLSSFTYIIIGGSAIEKPLLDSFRTKYKAFLGLVYGMTELLVPVFDYNESVPFGSAGKAIPHYQYRIVSDDEEIVDDQRTDIGELWIKSENDFFAGYYNNAEETDKVITKDGWVKTGDIFYKDENGYYFFVERKRLLIKYRGKFIAPLQLEEIIKQVPGVAEACVVPVPDALEVVLPVAVVARQPGHTVDPQDIFDLLKKSLPDYKQLHGGLIFQDAMPTTPSGKVHRAKLMDLALNTTNRIMPKE